MVGRRQKRMGPQNIQESLISKITGSKMLLKLFFKGYNIRPTRGSELLKTCPINH